jgi:mRNA interferase MazF
MGWGIERGKRLPMSVSRGDIVLVNLDPTKGSEIKKTRPVVIENDTGNQYSPTTIVAPMTTTLSQYPFIVILRAIDEDIDKDSAVQLD